MVLASGCNPFGAYLGLCPEKHAPFGAYLGLCSDS